jgi:hypothetical protein
VVDRVPLSAEHGRQDEHGGKAGHHGTGRQRGRRMLARGTVDALSGIHGGDQRSCDTALLPARGPPRFLDELLPGDVVELRREVDDESAVLDTPQRLPAVRGGPGDDPASGHCFG